VITARFFRCQRAIADRLVWVLSNGNALFRPLPPRTFGDTLRLSRQNLRAMPPVGQSFQVGTLSLTEVDMKSKCLVVSSIALVASAMAGIAAAQSALPPAIQADRTTIQQDAANVQAAFTQLRADEQAGNTAAVAADRTALRLARMQTGLDFGKLHQDAQGVIQPDQTTLMAALKQLHTDQAANNASAVAADQAAVQSAELQLSNDRTAIFGDLGSGSGMGHGHRHG
jgi:hypothetical protein